jgi:hypothetical protein
MAETENTNPAFDVEAAESWLISLSRELGRTLRWGKNGINTLIDASGSAFKTTKRVTKKLARFPKRSRKPREDEVGVFEELGCKLEECSGDDCSSLKDDAEFWNLVRQLHAIRKSGKTDAEAHPQE